jgi:hypothetical protein
VSEAEHPDRRHPDHQVSVDDVRQLCGASTPHFSGQIAERLRRLVAQLEADHPARVQAEREIARLTRLGFEGEVRGVPEDPEMPTLPSVSAAAVARTPGAQEH